MLSYTLSVITIGIDPTIDVGPLSIAWHGLTIAIGIAFGGALAARLATRRGLSPDPVWEIVAIVAVAGLAGGKLLYLAEHGDLRTPSRWLSGRGFSFNGGFILAALVIAVFVWRRRLSSMYLDVVAIALPLGVAIGRVGDVINGEHYGPRSDWLLAVRNSNPEADVPSTAVAYHSGGLYEVLLGAIVFAVMWSLRRRFRRPLAAMWTVVGLFGIGRFLEFFYRSDSDDVALGLSSAQWTSLGLVVVAIAGWAVTTRRERDTSRDDTHPARPPRAHSATPAHQRR